MWFVVLSVATGAHDQRLASGQTSFLALTLLVVTSGATVLLLTRSGSSFGLGLVTVLIVCMLLGITDGPYTGTAEGQSLLSVPLLFARGLASPAVWVALAASAALTWRVRGRPAATVLEPAAAAQEP
ncbi:hypothetical protein Q760_10255 [Cellulomonas cellasea DSM 20118]|uniref:Uncharacterized protein n=1 Tax=Cellulomonas cellasea DSM 20118 TaxID=1408250 RepID=A0A0A0BCP9_9CELL|nr:hypothetical protein Q760_10255 [Cellulomonas cellasea DSM 20118]